MRKYFPALMKYKNYIFCDNAGGSQVPKQVYNAFTEFLTNNYVQPYGNNILSYYSILTVLVLFISI